jgi:hypothetical protein
MLGPYYEIAITGQLNMTSEELMIIENGGDPFITSGFYVFGFCIFICFLLLCLRMLRLALRGYWTGKFNPTLQCEGKRILGSTPTNWKFAVEVIVLVGALNFLPPLLSPKILFGMHHHPEPIDFYIAIAISCIAMTLQMMFQFVGFLDPIPSTHTGGL